MKRKQIFSEAIIALLMLLFLYASFSKFADYEAFTRAMYAQPIPHVLILLLIYGLPAVEILVATGMAIEGTRKWALLMFLILMALFTFYISAIMLHWFPRVPCSCGGVIRALSWRQHLIFNLFFIGLALMALKMQPVKDIAER